MSCERACVTCAVLDSTRVGVSAEALAAWLDSDALASLRNRFVTGDWEQGRARAGARPDGEDGEVGGFS